MSRPLRILLVLIALAALGVFAWRWAAIDADPPVQQTPGAAVADAAPQSDDPAAQRIAADLRRLADDDMAGRETGTPGFERAAAFVAARMADAGLEPAGDDGTWFQRVPLLTGTPLREGVTATGLLDIAPTVCARLGVAADRDWEGVSLV